MDTYSVINAKGANLRIGPSTGAGTLRNAPEGTELSVVGIVKTNAGRDRWLLLTDIDPKTQEVWRYNGQEVSVYAALYVNGVHYTKLVEGAPVPPADVDHVKIAVNSKLEQAVQLIQTLKM